MSVLKDKTALVTGGTRGIGKEIASSLKKEGCKVLAVGRKDGDLSDYKGVWKLICLARRELKDVDILVNCAGTFLSKPITECHLTNYRDMFNINVQASWMLCKEFTEDMIENKWGRIINIGSISGYQGFPNSSIYCASKHAILGMSRALRGELKPYNIRVYIISPSASRTDMGKQIPNENKETFLDPKEIAEYVTFVMKFDKELISEEIRLNRMEKHK